MTCTTCKFDADVFQGKAGYCLPCFARVPGSGTLIPSNPEFVMSSKYYRIPKLKTNDMSVGATILKTLSRLAG